MVSLVSRTMTGPGLSFETFSFYHSFFLSFLSLILSLSFFLSISVSPLLSLLFNSSSRAIFFPSFPLSSLYNPTAYIRLSFPILSPLVFSLTSFLSLSSISSNSPQRLRRDPKKNEARSPFIGIPAFALNTPSFPLLLIITSESLDSIATLTFLRPSFTAR